MTAPIPVTGKTPIYEIEFVQEGEPAFHLRAKQERQARRLELLLQARALAPPAAVDLAAVTGRVTALETPGMWTDLPILGAPYLAHFALNPQAGAAQGASPTKLQYRLHQGRVWLRGWATSSTGGFPASNGSGASPLLTTALPAAFRPPQTATLVVPNSAGALIRLEVSPAGWIHSTQTVAGNQFLTFDGQSWAVS